MFRETKTMFFIFAGSDYYPNGGASDYVDIFASLEDAIRYVRENIIDSLSSLPVSDWIAIEEFDFEIGVFETRRYYSVLSLWNRPYTKVPGLYDKLLRKEAVIPNQFLGKRIIDQLTGEQVFISSREQPEERYCLPKMLDTKQ